MRTKCNYQRSDRIDTRYSYKSDLTANPFSLVNFSLFLPLFPFFSFSLPFLIFYFLSLALSLSLFRLFHRLFNALSPELSSIPIYFLSSWSILHPCATSHDDRYVIETFYTLCWDKSTLLCHVFIRKSTKEYVCQVHPTRNVSQPGTWRSFDHSRSLSLPLIRSLSLSLSHLLRVSKRDKKYISTYVVRRKHVVRVNLSLSFSFFSPINVSLLLVFAALNFAALDLAATFSPVSSTPMLRLCKLGRDTPCRRTRQDTESRAERRK